MAFALGLLLLIGEVASESCFCDLANRRAVCDGPVADISLTGCLFANRIVLRKERNEEAYQPLNQATSEMPEPTMLSIALTIVVDALTIAIIELFSLATIQLLSVMIVIWLGERELQRWQSEQRWWSEQGWGCAKCLRRFHYRAHLRAHLIWHSTRTELKCSRCMATYWTKPELHEHLKTHLRELMY